MERQSTKGEEISTYVVFFVILFLTYLSSFYNYLLFHTIAELFSIIIAGGIFVVGWNTRKLSENAFIFILGITAMFFNTIDLVHTIAYPGMHIFPDNTPNLAAQLWIGARYMQVISIFIAYIFRNRRIKPSLIIIVYLIVTSILLITIFEGWFPDCWAGTLTPFKVTSEYVIVLLFGISIGILSWIRRELNRTTYIFLTLSFVSKMISEMAFTFYVGAYDFSNLVGHLFKILAYFCLYKAIIQINLESPLQSLFRKLKRSEESLEEKARDLEEAYSESDQIFNSSIPIRVIDKDCTIVKVNESFLKYFNEKRSNIIGKKCYDVSTGHHCFKDSCSFNQIKAGCEVYEYEVKITNKENENLHYIIHSVPWYSRREIQGLIQTYMDITSRKIAEEKLKQSEERYRKLFDLSPIGIGISNQDGNVIAMNQSMEDILGYTVKELNDIGVGQTYENPGDRKKFLEILKKFGKVKDYTARLRRKDGHVFYGLITSEYLTLDGQQAIITNIRDITEEKKAQEAIQNLAKFPSENPNPVLRVNEEKILYINYSGRALFNADEGDDLIEVFKEPVLKAKEINIPIDIETNVLNRIYSFKITPIPNKGYVNIYGEDVTTRREAEKKLEQFVSVASHELLTPITVLKQSVELGNQYEEKLTEEQKRSIQKTISQNVHLLSELAKDLLTLSRIDEKRISMEIQEYKPSHLIQNILKTLELPINSKKITINFDVEDRISLNGDVQSVSRIFMVLIDNAVKYSRENGIITIKAIDKYTGPFNTSKADGILIQVKDNGIGIKEDDITKLFQRFFRSDAVGNIPGTGLGLAIADELVKLHKGEIHVESVFGEGSTFSVFLPKN
ncbi:MAG: MASE3 domain-containing protein [Candidatus Hodarchaeota archaeon]